MVTHTGVVNDGNSGINDNFCFEKDTTGETNALALTVAAATNTKTYNGTTSAAATPTITVGALQTGDTTTTFAETYGTRNVGTGQTLTPTGVVNDGNSGNNYTYTYRNETTGVTNALALTVAAATNTKTYNGTTRRSEERRVGKEC